LQKSLWEKFIDLSQYAAFKNFKQAKISEAGKNPAFAKAGEHHANVSAKRTKHNDYQRMMHSKRATIEKAGSVPQFVRASNVAASHSRKKNEYGDFTRSMARRKNLISAGEKAGI